MTSLFFLIANLGFEFFTVLSFYPFYGILGSFFIWNWSIFYYSDYIL